MVLEVQRHCLEAAEVIEKYLGAEGAENGKLILSNEVAGGAATKMLLDKKTNSCRWPV